MKVAKKKPDDKLQEVLKSIHNEVGDDAIRQGILTGGVLKCESISTRCLALDYALGVGGVPKGRVIEIFGPEGSGKTTLALTIVAECQRQGGIAAYIDAENAIDPTYAQNIGIDLDSLLFAQPDHGEQAIKICQKLIQSHLVGVIVIDSVAAMVPKEELDGEIDAKQMAPLARLMSKSLRMLSSEVNKSNICLIFINQIREKVGMMMPGANRETTPGGRALRYYASVRMDIRRKMSISEVVDGAKQIIGNVTMVKVIKNKVAPPFRNAEFAIIFGKGISEAGSLLDLGCKFKLIDKSGSWFSYNNQKIGQGWLASLKYLEENKDVMAELNMKLREKLLSKSNEEVFVGNGDTDDAEDIESGESGESGDS
jgi:recombination protein RecA